MNQSVRLLVWTLLSLTVVLFGASSASAQNEQSGDNKSSTEQSGGSTSGDAVAGQVTGVVSAGETSLDAANRSEDVAVETGDATGENSVANHTGQLTENVAIGIVGDPQPGSDVAVSLGVNRQDGNNSSDIVQAAEATSGDGVGGQVIGVVTSAGGSADIVAANTSQDVAIDTGDAVAANAAEAFSGQTIADATISAGFAALDSSELSIAVDGNLQRGDNDLGLDHVTSATTGDGVGGQVLGVVSGGDASVDATNSSHDADIATGAADAANTVEAQVGQLGENLSIEANAPLLEDSQVSLTAAANLQEGDNSSDLSQAANASSGDGVGGQVTGVVTSAGGSADIVAASTSEDVDIETGGARASNAAESTTGQADGAPVQVIAASIVGSEISITAFANLQEGDNSGDIVQAAESASGDGVGGQVLGVVSAGDASLDSTNLSQDVDIQTGDVDATNTAAAFVGQLADGSSIMAIALNIPDSELAITAVGNVQIGDNEQGLTQNASATSGDAVAGQVAGVVTSAAGSADLVLANASDGVDAESGGAEFDNEDESFVGQEIFVGGLLINVL